MHDTGIVILVFVVGSLLLGSLLKIFLSNSKIPYTVLLLLVGLGLASMVRAGWLGDGVIPSMLQQVGSIDAHFILFLFLPILIFESAFSMEPHLFFRIAPQTILLAVVGLLISMVLSASLISWFLPWGMGVALLFGALISATDPVAVVALLKEKSSRKRLETLMEGESLLNDGTAIVFFSMFYGFALRATTTKIEPLTVIGEFIWVVAAGLLVGAVIGWLVLWLVGKLFNQPLVEITLSIAAAYVTFIVAEELHLSGVIALVSLALMFSTIGRTRISPEVSHFLHQFWHMMSHIANTLIFFIVGIVIALNISLASQRLWLVLVLLYVALTFIRALSVWSLMPLLRRIGVGITHQKATVLVWGGLRGAVSLSMALALARDEAIAEPLRNQILFLTAGVVVLTIVVNGSTMEWLLHVLKLDKLPKAKEASVQRACQIINTQMDDFSRTMENDPFFNSVDLKSLRLLINNQPEETPAQAPQGLEQEELDIAFMRRLLEIERSDYWRQYEEGHIGRQAVFELSRSVDLALDSRPVISPRPSLQAVFVVPTPPQWMHHLPVMGSSMEEWLMSRLSLSYDIARGFVAAQEEMRCHVEKLRPDREAGQRIETMVDGNCTEAFSFIRHISEKYPLLIQQLQSRSARRMLLNHRRSLIWKMQHDGILEEAEAQHLIDNIETKLVEIRQEQTA